MLERASLFERTLGHDSDVVHKQMFRLQDYSKNCAKYVLRPEATAAIVRADLAHFSGQPLPRRHFYVGPMFRCETQQRGRYRCVLA